MFKNQNPKKKRTSFHRNMTLLLLLLVTTIFIPNVNAQCAMCRAAIESEGNQSTGKAINDGIVYLMVIPYLLVGGIGFAVYRMNKRKKI